MQQVTEFIPDVLYLQVTDAKRLRRSCLFVCLFVWCSLLFSSFLAVQSDEGEAVWDEGNRVVCVYVRYRARNASPKNSGSLSLSGCLTFCKSKKRIGRPNPKDWTIPPGLERLVLCQS